MRMLQLERPLDRYLEPLATALALRTSLTQVGAPTGVPWKQGCRVSRHSRRSALRPCG
jgi:hypothetical protein